MKHAARKYAEGRARPGPAAWVLAGAVLLPAAAWLASPWLPPGGAGGHWLARGLTSRLTLLGFAAMGGCLAGLFVLGAGLWRAGGAARWARRRRKDDGEGGAAAVEFVLILPLGLMLSLMLAQSAMLLAGNLCVHYSAYCAARTAIVTIPDGERQPDQRIAQHPEDEGYNLVGSTYYSVGGAGQKGRRIWRAAVWAVTPVSAGSRELGRAEAGSVISAVGSLFGSFGMDAPAWAEDMYARRLAYAEDYTAVSWTAPAGGYRYGENEDITVQVEHTLYLSVPYANRIIANVGDGVKLPFGADEYGTVVRADCTLTNEGVRDYVEEESYDWLQ